MLRILRQTARSGLGSSTATYYDGDERFHCVFDASGAWRVGVQLATNHVPPDWPNGNPQQVHFDLHVEDPRSAHEAAVALGARLLRSAPDFNPPEGRQGYADPAGHPFCIGWGHPSPERLASFVEEHFGPAGAFCGANSERPVRTSSCRVH